MKRALLIAITATLILTSLAFAQPTTWRSLSLERGQTFSVACPDEIVLLHIDTHELIGHCGAGGTVPPDHTVFQSPLPAPPDEDATATAGQPASSLYLPLGAKQ